jgi:hypothetical protein
MDIRTFFSSKQRSQVGSKKQDNENALIIRTKIKKNGIEYFVTTNADIQDKTIKKFVNSLIDSLIDNKEQDEEELFEGNESLQRILTTCMIVSDEIKKITSSLNSRLDSLDRLDRL